jgi:pectate lyase
MKMSSPPSLKKTFYFKKTLFALSALFIASESFSAPVGYASLNGGTTGGAGGEVAYASTGAEIHQAMCNRASDDTPLIIYVSGTINHGNTSKYSGSCDTKDDEIQFKGVSNISLIGTGSGAVFDQIGIHLRDTSNIILQNLHIKNVKKSGSPTSNGGDAIGMESGVFNVWVDHCTLEATGGEDDGYDSLLDMKATTQYVTVSYTHYNHSGRGGLMGSSDSDDSNTFVTFHHNYYQNIDSRMPLLRHGTAHSFNNYFNGIAKSGMNPRMGGKIKAEHNHFENAHNPIGTFYTTNMGYWDLKDNIFENVTWSSASDEFPAGPNPVSTTSINIPYSYQLDAVSCVKNIVLATVGAGTGLATSDGSCTVDPGDPDEPGSSSSSSAVSSVPPVSSSSSSATSSSDDTPGELGINLALGGGSDGSSKGSGTSYGDVRDGDLSSYWSPSSSSGQRISIKGMSGSFNTVIIRELNGATTSWRLVNNDNGTVLASGSSLGSERVITGFGTISAGKINLMIDSASSAPQIAEFEVYNASGSVISSAASSAASSSSDADPQSSAPSSGQIVTYEAENAMLYRGTADNIHSGFSGSGFADFENVNESYIEWTVNQAVAGNATATFRYANGTSAGRPLAISVNGTVINGSLAFNGTGAWSSWATQSITLPLNAGTNVIRAASTTSTGGPNMDYLQLTGSTGNESSSSSSDDSSSQSSESSSSAANNSSVPGSSSSSANSSLPDYSGPISNDCIDLATNPNVNWRDTSLQSDQEIVECLAQTLGQPVGYGENARGGYDPNGNSKLTVISKNSSQSVEQQIFDAISDDEPNWIVFDKFDFANSSEVAMYRLQCSNSAVQSHLGATEAECIDYTQWCSKKGISSNNCVSEFFNNALNENDLPIRNIVVGSNKTLDGRMSEAFFRFNGFAIGRDSSGQPTQTANSVILTHLNFVGAGHTEDHGLDPDMIRVTGASHDVWIHRNNFDTTGDAAFDVKVGAYDVTISFNKLIDVKRASLHGSSDSRTINSQITTTMHHNAFITRDESYSSLGNTLRRIPLIRRGTSHMFNNIFVNYRKDILSIRVGASVLWEDNAFVVNRAHQEKSSLESSLDELQSNLVRDIGGGNFRGEGIYLWFSDAACNIDSTTQRQITESSGSVGNLTQQYSSRSQNNIANWRFDAGQELVDYVSATAGRDGALPFNSPLAGDRYYVLGLGKVACQ